MFVGEVMDFPTRERRERCSFAKRAGWIIVTDDDDVFVLVVIDKKILLG